LDFFRIFLMPRPGTKETLREKFSKKGRAFPHGQQRLTPHEEGVEATLHRHNGAIGPSPQPLGAAKEYRLG
jgi:hypothetical protein